MGFAHPPAPPARAARGRRSPAPPGCAGCARERVTTTWSASRSRRDPAAVVADHRDRQQPAPARLGQRLDHVRRVAARREREQRVALAPVGDHLAREDRLGADVVGDRGEDRRVLGEVERAPRRPAGVRRDAEVGHHVHRVGGRAAVAEREQRAAGVEPARSAAAAASSSSRVVRERLLAQRADLLRLRQHRAAHVLEHGVEVVLALARGTDRGSSRRRRRARALAPCSRGARRRRARAPRARGRASRPAPGARRVGCRRLELPLGARPARTRSSGSRAARRRGDLAAPTGPKAMAMSSGSRQPSCAPARRRSAAADRRQRALADDHRVHELDRDVARVRARRRRVAERDQPAAARRSARPSRGRAARAARPRPRRSCCSPRCAPPAPASSRRPSAPSLRRPLKRAPRTLAAMAASQSRQRVDALARARADQHPLARRGAPRRGCSRQLLEVEVQVREQVDLVDQHQLAGAEHQRVLERLVLALGDRGDHHPRVLADPELGRADEVADVLDHEQVDLVERQRRAAPSGPCSRRGGTRRRSPDRC